MKISSWQKLISYIKDIEIETISSDFNPVLSVCIKNGRYQLCTEEAVYSYADKYDNFRLSFDKIDFTKNKVERVLLLGLGLGSIPFMLEKNYQFDFQYTAVEIDESVIYLADKYVLHDLKSPISVIQADADIFMQQHEEKYDMIAMDVFDSDVVPENFESLDFLINLKSCLSANGFVIYNRLAVTPQDRRESLMFYEEQFKVIFPNAIMINILGNYMLISEEKVLK